MLRAVVFDMDGVLVDSHAGHILAWNRLLRVFGRQLSERDIELLHEGLKTEELIRCFLGNLSRNNLRACSRLKQLFFDRETKKLALIAGVATFLRELDQARVSMALVSSGSRTRIQRTLSLLQLEAYFQTVVTGDDVKSGKTSPAIFYWAAQQLGFKPAEVLVFEDSISAVRVATSAGMRCIGISNGNRAQALIKAGALRVLPNFIGMSYGQANLLFESTMRDYETSSRPYHLGQPPSAILEDC